VKPPPLFAALFTFGSELIETKEGVAEAETVTVDVRSASRAVEVVDEVVVKEIVDTTGVVAESGSAVLEGEREDAFSAAGESMTFEALGVPSHATVQRLVSSEDGR
jgi:hypothetical protein